MQPEEYATLSIRYSFGTTLFGEVLIASTSRGICYIAFADNGKDAAFAELQQHFPAADYLEEQDDQHRIAIAVMNGKDAAITLHVKGTPFRQQVWQKLLAVPKGEVISYSALAGDSRASRATGSAVAANPVACLIPCHRVVKASGETGQYHWGSSRKSAIIKWEAQQVNG